MKVKHFLITFILLTSALITTEAQSWLWARAPVFIGKPYNQSDGENWSVAADNAGNVYSTGFFNYAEMIYGSDTLEDVINPDMFLVKYNPAGSAVWAKQAILYNDYGECVSDFVACDQWGNVYVTGYFSDTVNLDGTLLISAGGTDAFVAKFNSSGNLLWVTKSEHPHFYGNLIAGNGIAADHAGNVYVTGQYGDTVTFGSYTLTALTYYNTDAFILKYDSNGNLLWAHGGVVPSYSSFGYGNAVATDLSNNAIITGRFYDTLELSGQMLISHAKAGEIFTAKYDPNGNLLWARQSVNHAPYNSGNGSVSGNAVTTDKWGNIYITGDFQDTVHFDSYQLISPYPSIVAYGDIFITRYDPSGNVVWAQGAVPQTDADYDGWSIAADTFGHIYFMGGGVNFRNGNQYNYTIQFGGSTFTSSGQPSWECSLVMELDTGGHVLCGAAIPIGGDDNAGITTDPSGSHVYIGGDYNVQYSSVSIGSSVLNFFPGQIKDSEDPFVVRWQPCVTGQPLSASATKTNVACGATCNGTASAIPQGGTGPYTFKWSTQPVDTAQNITGLCAGGYRLTVTDHTGATVTDSVTIIAQVLKTCTIAAVKDTLCAGDTATILVSGNTLNLQWLLSMDSLNYAAISGLTDSVYSFVAVQSYVFRVIAGTGSCPDTSSDYRLLVNPLPQPVVTASDTIFCSGDSARLCTSNSFISYLWNTYDTTYCTTASLAGGYWVAVTDSNHCSAQSGHRQINVYPVTSVSIIQQGDTLSSYGQRSYQWIRNGVPVDSATGPVYVARQSGSYALQVTDSNGCTTTSNAVTVTDVQNLAEESISIYPNPAVGNWQLKVNNRLIGSTAELYDAEGRLLTAFKITAAQSEIKTSGLPRGCYFLKIQTGGDNYFLRVINQ